MPELRSGPSYLPEPMTRAAFLRYLPAVAFTPALLAACRTGEPTAAPAALPGTGAVATGAASGMAGVPAPDPSIVPLVKTKAEWQRLLEADRYAVLFEEATERPHSSPLNDEHGSGTFVCAACHLPLFESDKKFESGTGWPSFFDPIHGHLGTKVDTRLAYENRTEYHCVRCGGHQGHIFEDGPAPTGLRYCNNGLALLFTPTGTALPALRT